MAEGWATKRQVPYVPHTEARAQPQIEAAVESERDGEGEQASWDGLCR